MILGSNHMFSDMANSTIQLSKVKVLTLTMYIQNGIRFGDKHLTTSYPWVWGKFKGYGNPF